MVQNKCIFYIELTEKGEFYYEKLFIAVHGNMSNKEDVVIQILAEEALQKGYQVLSFDLPEHGERKSDSTPCKVQFCVSDLSIIMNYAKEHWKEVSLFACSMGTYFSLLAYQDDMLKKALFSYRRTVECIQALVTKTY